MFKILLSSTVLKKRLLSPKLVSKIYSRREFRPFFDNFLVYSNNTAIIDDLGPHKYRDILQYSYLIAKEIVSVIPNNSEKNARISFLCSNDYIYLCVLLACWISGNIAVPLCSKHPDSLLEYFIHNSQSCLAIASDHFSDRIENITSRLKIKFFKVDPILKDTLNTLNTFHNSEFSNCNYDYRYKKALIIYTSGSTGLPKGVVLTHNNLYAQVSSLVKAWEITSSDSILHTLPLHHMHGIMNALLCPLSVGGTVVMQPNFKASEVWSWLIHQNQLHSDINLFFGVPTMYISLIDELKHLSKDKEEIRKYCTKNIRLMTSGSAALPEPIFHKWKDITGHDLLERFGMSEIGMALSNPLKGPRIPGSVGTPLPGVEVKIVEDSSSEEETTLVKGNDSFIENLQVSNEKSGELLIRGPTVFKEYWNNEKATSEAFTDSGWFKTGLSKQTAVCFLSSDGKHAVSIASEEEGYYLLNHLKHIEFSQLYGDTAVYHNGSFKILGRTTVDIIKSGGYKISALQVESCLLLHPNVKDCAVFGVPDNKWGERLTALVVTKDKKIILDSDLNMWCKKFLPVYSIPTIIKYVDSIPRNIMGKMNKKELKNLFL